ncbi:MAG TPA: FtsX-like permease family protein [Xanthomonadaceae bacterium]|nr:FtsX-like permease family protein [Xanthomonadaceae bacterium]
MTAPLRLAWRFLRRDLAAGEVRVLIAALVLAVTAVTTIGFVTDRAERALALEANRLLGGDAVLRADEPIADPPRELAARLGLRQAETLAFPSMVRAGEALKLAEIRALGEGYPLHGAYALLREPTGEPYRARDVPGPGSLWLSRAGAQALGVGVGDTLKVGAREFAVAALVAQEPDNALDYFNVAPRVFLRRSDVESTGLLQEGSRVGYRLAVAGEGGAVQVWADAVRDALERGQRLETIQDARPELRNALERADRFLGLAALVSVVLAAVAVALAARRHAARHLDACAVLRCLGASQRTILTIHAGELVLLGALGSALGVAAGHAIQAALAYWLADLMKLSIPGAGALPALQGLAVGLVVLIAFALPPVLALRRVPALRVLRRELGEVSPGAVLVAGAGTAGVVALLWWKAGSATLALAVLAGIAATLAVLGLLGFGLIALLRSVRTRLSGPWRFGLANVGRRPAASVAQIAALGLGLMAILLLTLVRTDLLERWRASLPADAPNRFIINVQPDQVEGVREVLASSGVSDPVLYPMIRGRLIEVNGEPVRGADYGERGDRARRLAEREFNLSWTADLRGTDNRIVAGRFWSPQARGSAEVSVERGIAEALGWAVGDRVAFDIAGRRFDAEVTSLREVEWESFRPNFFVVAPPGTLEDYAASWITAVRGDAGLTAALVQRFPNVTVIDVDAIIDQVRAIGDRVALAIEYVFYFTLVAGLLVLVAAVTATQDERLLEGGVMRVLGASTLQLRLAHASEFAAIGLLAGLTAAIAAAVLSGVIATQVFDLRWQPDWRLALVGGGIGLVAVTLVGLTATHRVVAAPPSTTLRALQG